MLAPLVIGWALAAGMHPALTAVFGLLIWNAATFGSLLGYATGEDPSIPSDWGLEKSERYRSVQEHIESYEFEDWYILRSRVGKFAAYCGHVNIAAGANKYYWLSFLSEAALGHLPEIRDFVVAYPSLVWAAIICTLIVAMVIYIVRHYRVVRHDRRR